nr:hypothetical protein [Tanacetum cinerariifolium]
MANKETYTCLPSEVCLSDSDSEFLIPTPWFDESKYEKKGKRWRQEFKWKRSLFEIDFTFGINAFDLDKGTNVMKDKVSQENVCDEEVSLNNNIGKQIGDFVDMPSEAVEQGMDANVPDKICQYKDAKTLFEAIQARFGCNDTKKKTQRTLLKQMYKNFNAPSTESLDSIFNMLQKIISQLVILGENISQEDLNMKFLRSLPSDTNKVDTANIQVSTVSTSVSTVSSHDNTANLSDAIVKQESRLRNQDSSRKTVNVEDKSSKAMVVNYVNTAKGNKVTSDIGKQRINAIKSSACWVWRPKIRVQYHVSKNSGSYICKRFDNVDPAGRLKHMTGNISRLTDFKEHDGGYVAFGGGAKGVENVEKGTSQREVRPVWNNPMRTNHQNFSNSRRNFAPTTVLTKFGIVPISTARQSSSRAAAQVSAARPINTAASKPLVNVAKPRQNALQNSHSLSRRPLYQKTTLKTEI